MTSAGTGAMPTPLWSVVEDHSSDPHVLQILVPATKDWLEAIANAYRELRTASSANLESVSLDGVEVLSTQALEERLVGASVPTGTHPIPQFAVPRSDLAEVLLGEVMSQDFGTLYGYRSIRDRELVELPGRGIDQIGVEVASASSDNGDVEFASSDDGPALVLMLGEAKTTTSTDSPPNVVDNNDDCLRSQHLAHFADVDATAVKVVEASRRCQDPTTRAAFLLADQLLRDGRFDLLRVACTSLLVRPSGLGEVGDFGTFDSSPEDYAPGVVRFVIFRLDSEDLEAVVDKFIELAQAVSAGGGESA